RIRNGTRHDPPLLKVLTCPHWDDTRMKVRVHAALPNWPFGLRACLDTSHCNPTHFARQAESRPPDRLSQGGGMWAAEGTAPAGAPQMRSLRRVGIHRVRVMIS